MSEKGEAPTVAIAFGPLNASQDVEIGGFLFEIRTCKMMGEDDRLAKQSRRIDTLVVNHISRVTSSFTLLKANNGARYMTTDDNKRIDKGQVSYR